MQGIYKLNFIGTNYVYIGQSIDIMKRYSVHLTCMRQGIHSKKLQEAYAKYGEPSIQVLEECDDADFLDITEEFYIKKFNSVLEGFNSTTKAAGGVSIGEDNGNSKNSNEIIIEAFFLLTGDTLLSLKEIASITSVSHDTIKQISRGVQYTWLKKLYPTKYQILLDRKNNRASIGNSAQGRGIVYPPIRSPNGKVYTVTNCKAFAEEHGLFQANLRSVLIGKRLSCAGWKLDQVSDKP